MNKVLGIFYLYKYKFGIFLLYFVLGFSIIIFGKAFLLFRILVFVSILVFSLISIFWSRKLFLEKMYKKGDYKAIIKFYAHFDIFDSLYIRILYISLVCIYFDKEQDYKEFMESVSSVLNEKDIYYFNVIYKILNNIFYKKKIKKTYNDLRNIYKESKKISNLLKKNRYKNTYHSLYCIENFMYNLLYGEYNNCIKDKDYLEKSFYNSNITEKLSIAWILSLYYQFTGDLVKFSRFKSYIVKHSPKSISINSFTLPLLHT